jgi:hypothetical protein
VQRSDIAPDLVRGLTAINAWPARIRQRVFQGDFTQYHVDWDGRTLIVRSAAAEPLAEDDEVFVSADLPTQPSLRP